MKYILPLFLLCCYIAQANAGVRSIAGDGSSAPGISSSHFSFATSEQLCAKEGYNTNCAVKYPGSRGISPCPHDASYFKGCCQAPYVYTINECVQQGLIPSNEDCYGYHACEEP